MNPQNDFVLTTRGARTPIDFLVTWMLFCAPWWEIRPPGLQHRGRRVLVTAVTLVP